MILIKSYRQPVFVNRLVIIRPLKIDWKKLLSALNLLLILLSIPVSASENSAEAQISQEQNEQQNKLPEQQKKYSFLSKPLFSNTDSHLIQKVSSANKESSTNKEPSTNNKSLTSKEPSTKNQSSLNGDALNVSLGLIVILLMIFSLAWFMKKIGYSSMTGQGQLKIIASLNLGQKEKIALIQVGKQQLLVGMTATQINTLHVLDEVLEETEIKQSGSTGNGAFASKFSELLKYKQNNVK